MIMMEVKIVEKNITIIEDVIDYIEIHLEEKLDLDNIARQAGYSKYHLHRMFTSIVGFTVHNYIQRRRLTEAARLLVFTDKSIIDIALSSGYETQQSFTIGFKAMFKYSPQVFRRKHEFYPFQLKFCVDGNKQLRGDTILDVKIIEHDKILLVGFTFNTRFGFLSMGKYWRKLHSKKQTISNRTDMNFLIGLNDYSSWLPDKEKQPAFDYYSAAEVTSFSEIPKGMVIKELPASKYVVFHFRAKSQDSLGPVADYIYKIWFPQSTCQLNESAKYDFAKYGEEVDEEGKSQIEYWVPIL